MTKRFFQLIICYFIFINSVIAQRPNSFSFDPDVFINEFETFMKTGKSEAKDAADDFAGNFNAGKISAAQKVQVIRMCNEMLQAQAQLNTDFYYYIKTINAFVNNDQMTKFDHWQKTLSAAVKRSKDEFQRFLIVSKNVFSENVLLRVGNFTWASSSVDVDLQMQGQATFVFKKLDLFCYTPGDTFEIYNTSGKYLAGTNEWIGNGGKLDWSRVGLDPYSVYALLNKYKIDLTDGLMSADSALFYNKSKFQKGIVGKVFDRPLPLSQGNKSIFPQFESTEQAFTGINYGRAKYKGGFGMKGAVVLGKSSGEQKAELYFYYKNKPVLRVAADEFFVRENKINNDKVELTIFLEKDSIFHPQLQFNYDLINDRLSFYHDSKTGISAAPFGDYYHNLEFYVDEVKWDLNNPKIDLKMLAGDDPAKFQSINYFREIIYEHIQNLLDYNPLQRISQYCLKNNSNTFDIRTYAAAFKSNISDIKIQMIDLADMGFLNYKIKSGLITIKPKLKEYVLAHYGKTDFDAIAFKSIISAIPNASISLINNDLIIQGVPKFNFSDSQNVYIVPKNQVINVKKNRSMEFSGRLRGGMADFYGSNFLFDYTKFDIRLNNVDSLKFLYYDDSLQSLMHVKSVIENIYGTLEIDHPYNKGSRKRFTNYPIFTSEVGSKVFYAYPTTQKGSYTKDRFWFAVDPFRLDSLSNLNLYTLALAGTLVSDGIVPDMRQEIYLQPDKSLGFYIPNDPNFTYQLYKDKGTARVALRLSNDGLIGEGGIIYYLASRSASDRFVFFLDSMNSECESFENDKSSLFPTVINSKNVYNHWIPYQDTMFISNRGEPIKIAYDRAELRGTIILTPFAMMAKGSLTIEDGELLADIYTLKPAEFLSENATFRQRWPKDTSRIAFSTNSVNAYVNVDERYAEFTYNNPCEINNNFFFNNYDGSFSKLRWDMAPRTLEFKGSTEQENKYCASFLISKRPNQKRLTFKTSSVKISVDHFILRASNVPYINIADSRVLPDSGKVTIRENAEMDMLLNAIITADTINKFHRIEQVSLKVDGRTNVTGLGNYIYVDKNKKEQKFFLSQIYVEEQQFLGGKSTIPDSIKFLIEPKLIFRGNALLHSYNKNLEYNGYFHPVHNLYLPRTDWFKSAAVINPDSVYINLVAPLKNAQMHTLVNGFYVSTDSTHVYPALFTRKYKTSDAELFKCEGTFAHNEVLDEFRVGPYDKVFNKPMQKGNFLVVNEPKKQVYGEGLFNLGFETPHFKISTAGSALFNLRDTLFTMNLTMIMDFQLPPAAMRLMVDSLIDASEMAPSNNIDVDHSDLKRHLKLTLPELVEEKNLKKLTEDPSVDLTGKTIDELFKTIFVTDITFMWNQPTRSFTSIGNFGIRSFEKFLFEKRMNGKIEITKRRGGDELIIYLQPIGGGWYYFKYIKGTMLTVASDPVYNELIKTTCDKVSNDDYKLRPASISDRNKFVRAMKKQIEN